MPIRPYLFPGLSCPPAANSPLPNSLTRRASPFPAPDAHNKEAPMFRSRALFALVVCATVVSPGIPQEMHMTARTTPAFDQLKALVGTWEGVTQDGKKGQATYELISNGSVLMERMHPGNEPD